MKRWGGPGAWFPNWGQVLSSFLAFALYAEKEERAPG